MIFTYDGYRQLMNLLKQEQYSFVSYHNYKEKAKTVILRHDIDNSPAMAAKLSEVERESGVTSTFFVLLTSDFYNVMSAPCRNDLYQIIKSGSEIGLHFDEKQYVRELSPLLEEGNLQAYAALIREKVKKEATLLSEIMDYSVRVVSMHRPSPVLLEQNLSFDSIVNSYGFEFFKQCKYLSDSRRHWREPVEQIISENKYPHLHILTHSFWYHDRELTLEDSIRQFILGANQRCYDSYEENFHNLAEVLKRADIT